MLGGALRFQVLVPDFVSSVALLGGASHRESFFMAYCGEAVKNLIKSKVEQIKRQIFQSS
jgi:hypothetical protein